MSSIVLSVSLPAKGAFPGEIIFSTSSALRGGRHRPAAVLQNRGGALVVPVVEGA